ncbi:MAG: CBS domain-containing protein [Ardenticatenaceae bacterium]|nr:CBS domain-containing protein [Ardenticatenaceae bacterium]
MSPRAAWRLESLGFTQVFDYTAGKADWFAFGLPAEGKLAELPRAGEAARRDVPTCRLTERVGDVRTRVEAAGWDTCLVVNEEGVVLGRLRAEALGADAAALVETIMEPGPTTIRPNTLLEAITTRMQARKVDSVVVSTSDGRLVGVLFRSDAERRLADVQGASEGGV